MRNSWAKFNFNRSLIFRYLTVELQFISYLYAKKEKRYNKEETMVHTQISRSKLDE